MTELAAMRQIVGAEQDTDIMVELWLSTFAGDTVRGQVPPQIIALTFFGVDVAIDGFLTNP